MDSEHTEYHSLLRMSLCCRTFKATGWGRTTYACDLCMYDLGVFVFYRWLDKLGLAAKLGLEVVMRQVLIGSGTYHLVDNNLDPLPVCYTLIRPKAFINILQINMQVPLKRNVEKKTCY